MITSLWFQQVLKKYILMVFTHLLYERFWVKMFIDICVKLAYKRLPKKFHKCFLLSEIIWKEMNSSPDFRTAWDSRVSVLKKKDLLCSESNLCGLDGICFQNCKYCTLGLIESFPLFSFNSAYVENGYHLVKLSARYFCSNFKELLCLTSLRQTWIIFAMLNLIIVSAYTVS